MLEQIPLGEQILIDDIADRSGVPKRKAKIVLVRLKRPGRFREYRGGHWSGLSKQRRPSIDLSAGPHRLRAGRYRPRQVAREDPVLSKALSANTLHSEYFGEEVERMGSARTATPCDQFGKHRISRRAAVAQ